MKSEYDAIVIGSGLGGLTAGALYAKHGKRVLVLERHLQFGGAATVFHRKGMRIDAGLHEIDGLDKDDPKLFLFQQLELGKALNFVTPQSFYSVRHPSIGGEFIMPKGVDAAVQATISRFPNHEKAIRQYFKTICLIRERMSRYIRSYRNWLWWMINGPIFPLRFWPIIRYERMTVGTFLQKLFGDDEAIKLALCANYIYYTENLDKLSLLFFSAAQGSYHMGGGHYIKGGSQSLSNHLVSIIRDHGGEGLARRTVKKILMEGNRVIGVEHEKAPVIAIKSEVKAKDPQQAFAPVIFGNAAPHELGKMLPEENREHFMAPYQNKNVSTSLWSIYLGLKQKPENFGVTQYSTFIYPDWIRSLRDIPPTISLLRNPPGEKVPGFVFVDYNQIDSDLTDEGYYLGVLCGLDHISNWIDMDEETYRLRKEQWIDTFIQTLNTSFPGISESIIYKEMATARTVKDYLNTPQGAVYGFAQEPEQAGRLRPHGKTPIKGLWLASAFTFPGGGFSGAMLAGESAVRDLLKRDYSPN